MGSIRVRFEDGVYVPAVNVKPRVVPLPSDLQSATDDVRQRAFDRVAEAWWGSVPGETADLCFRAAFKGCKWDGRRVGRSGGWLAVFNIGKPEDWNARQLKAWERFEKLIDASMAQAERDYQEELRKIWLPPAERVRTVAKRLHHEEGVIEFDDDAEVSRHDESDDRGAYVQAWVWVSYDEVIDDEVMTLGVVKAYLSGQS